MEENTRKPTYDELSNTCAQLVKKIQELDGEVLVMKYDRAQERLKLMLGVIKDAESYPEDIVKLAEQHCRQIMAIPTNG